MCISREKASAEGEVGVGFRYLFASWNWADYDLQLQHCWWGHQPKQNKLVLTVFS